MAAMAPALTDASAEARHIRFKLAAPSTSLSPNSPENNSNTSDILLSAAAPAANGKLLGSEFHNGKSQEQPLRIQPLPVSKPPSLGKLQPLVASYLCSDVTPVTPTAKAKESLKLQGILLKQSVLKGHGLLGGSLFHSSTAGTDFLLRKRQALEPTGGQLKSLVNGAGAAMVPTNGLAKKAAVPSAGGAEKGCAATVNGNANKPPSNREAPPSPKTLPHCKAGASTATTSGQGHLQQQAAADAGQVTLPNSDSLAPAPGQPEGRAESPPSAERGVAAETYGSGGTPTPGTSIPALQCSSLASSCSSAGLEVQLRERAQQSRCRQTEVEARLRRLRKRLQVVQAKQVERHVRQQLGGFLDAGRKTAVASVWRGTRTGAEHPPGALARFLKDDGVTSELERLHLSGTSNLRSAESAFDSDATASSSGGDSDAEEEELARVHVEQRHVKLWRRAEARYAVERASIISHWAWLQAHISDLEYRIRQQADIHRQIRARKGAVELGDVTGTAAPPPERQRAPASEAVLLRSSQNAADELSRSEDRLAGGSVNGTLSSSVAADVTDMKCPLTPDWSCMAARTRPLLSCRRRRLVHPQTVSSLNSKLPRDSCPPTSGCALNPSCVTCGGGRLLSTHLKPYKHHLLETLALQDPCVHPILSLQSDVSVSVHLQRVLKSQWTNGHAKRLKVQKKLSLKRHGSLTSSSTAPSSSKHRFKLSTSHRAAVRLSHYKSRLERSLRQTEGGACASASEAHAARGPDRAQERSLSRKRRREPSLERSETPKIPPDAASPCSSLSSLYSSTSSPLSRALAHPSESAMGAANSTACSMPIRRRRGESSFDINNIVIPMSVAATTRVEKLQYKEIITPSWREMDVFAQPLAEEDDIVEVEDLSDAVFSLQHQQCEDQERLRWRWTALPPAKRRGSRSYKSLDGRTTPLFGGTNPSTPQPSSPDTGYFHLLQDYGPVASPLSPASPDTPCSRDTHRPLVNEDTRCSTPDCSYEERTVLPWELRTFPLEEDPFQEPEEPGEPEWTPAQRFPPGSVVGHQRTDSESEVPSP